MTTEYEIGQKVWLVVYETGYGNKCEHCDNTVYVDEPRLVRGVVTKIVIARNDRERYTVTDPNSDSAQLIDTDYSCYADDIRSTKKEGKKLLSEFLQEW